jgi:diadenylate cyclase
MGVILTKANQAIQTLEKYKVVLSQSLTNLSALEFEELVTLQEVAHVVQRVEMVLRVKMEIKRYVTELGTEGRLIAMQMDELVNGVDEDAWYLLKDYAKDNSDDKIREIRVALKKLSAEDLLDAPPIIRLLGYTHTAAMVEEAVSPRGFRLLNKIPRLPLIIMNNLIERFARLPHILMATIDELDEVDGIGEVRARAIKDGLKRIQEQMFIDRQI